MMSPWRWLCTRRGGDACVALVPSLMGDASVPSLPSSQPRPPLRDDSASPLVSYKPPPESSTPAPAGVIHAPPHNPSPLGRGHRAPGAVPTASAFDAAGTEAA